MTMRKLHVLVVDDSAVVREAMATVLSMASGITVTTAADPIIARHKIAAARPDVILLDLEMPREDGLTFLKELVATDPIPVVICSSHSTAGSKVALEALREGAVDVVAKARLGVREFVQESAILIVDAVRAAAGARRPATSSAPLSANPLRRLRPSTLRATAAAGQPSRRVIAIAASTGGPQALNQVLGAMPADTPGIVVVQHMPAGFTTAFAAHLDRQCGIEVKEAANGDPVVDGRALIAPGDRHIAVVRTRGQLHVEVRGGPLVSRHRPSADILFGSVARTLGRDAIGVIMTGMGDDGADGLREMRNAGASTIAQDEASCVVFGMPREAIARGAVCEVEALDDIASAIVRWAQPPARAEIPLSHPPILDWSTNRS
jgi:two-component system chemotaxis response regulator CheB